jgi:Vacuolar protein sorting-associated protein 62
MNTSRKFGDLLITLTSGYDMRYNDRGSGSPMDGTFWHPRSEGGFRPVASVCVAGYGDINNNRASMLVADAGNGAVAAPTGYSWVWNDAGSGASMDGSVWRPVAPAGYIALGDVATSNHDAPSVNDVWCVRADLVTTGVFAGDRAWQDRGSGGRSDIAAWPVVLGQPSTDPTRAVLEPDTFFGVDNYDGPPNAGLARVLLVPVTAEAADAPARPSLTSRNAPEPTTAAVRDRSVTLPFTSMFDRTDRPSLDRIYTPFCTLERWAGWSLTLFDDNTTNTTQTQSKTTTVGVTETNSESFAHSAGIKISAEWGVVTKFKVELNYQFTYTSSSSSAVLHSDAVQRTLSTPPAHAAALWSANYTFRAVRADGSMIGRDLTFDANSFAHDQFPAPDHAGGTVLAS